MANVNEVVFNGNTLISLKNDTATAADVAQGKTFHLASGASATGTASVGDALTLLWTNPSPVLSAFAAQTVSLDLTDYDAVAIYTMANRNYNSSFPSIVQQISKDTRYLIFNNFVVIKKGKNNKLLFGAVEHPTTFQSYNICFRNVSVTASGVVFGDSYIYNNTVNNDYAIPYKIYGVKTSVELP